MIKEEPESDSQEKITPKLGKKVTTEVPAKGTRRGKSPVLAQKKDSKEKEVKVKRSLSKEPEEVKVKAEPVNDPYQTTIEEVIASSMLVVPNTEIEGDESASEGEFKGKRLVKNPLSKRGLRNGKLRQSTMKPEGTAFFIVLLIYKIVK